MAGPDDRDSDGLASTGLAEPALAATQVGDPPSGVRIDPFGRTAASGGDAGEPAVQVGATVGRYRLEEVIGAGGMGVVYRAHDVTLGRRVAVKVMRGDRDDHERLLREARTVAQLAHPGVVPVLDVVETERGDVHIVMELIDGGTLGKWLRAAPRPWQEVVARFGVAGRALADAHQAGVIHRDFKPDNVLLARDGRVLVSDFGLARGAVRRSGIHAAAKPIADGADDVDLTQSGAMLGTPAYMAPEQFRGDDVDARCDQFAFCVSVWEGVFGERPFAVGQSSTPGSALDSLRDEVLAGRRRAPPAGSKVPARLIRALERGLETEPAERWPDLRALLVELEATRAPKRRAPLLLAALGVAAGGAIAAVALTRGDGAPAARAPAIAVDAGAVATALDAAVATRAHRVTSTVPRLSLPDPMVRDVRVSSDGRTALVARGDGSTVRVDVDTVALVAPAGEEIVAAAFGADRRAYAVTWAPDGVRARLVSSDGQLGDGPRLATTPQPPAMTARGGWVAIGADGTTAAIASRVDVALGGPDGERWRVSLADARALALSPDGAWLAVASVEAGVQIISLLATADGKTAAREAFGAGELPKVAWLGDALVVGLARDHDNYVVEELRLDGGGLRRLGTVHVGTGLLADLAAGDGGLAIATIGSRGTVLRGVLGATLTARTLPGEPRLVLGSLGGGELAVTVATRAGIEVAIDGGARTLAPSPAGCVPIGAFRDGIACALPGTGWIRVQAGATTIAELVGATSARRVACTAAGLPCVIGGDAANGDPELWLIEAGHPPRALGIGGVGDGSVAIAEDGTIAVAGCDEILVVRTPAGEVRELAVDGISCAIAFTSDREVVCAVMGQSMAVELVHRQISDGAVLGRMAVPLTMVQSMAMVGGDVALVGVQVGTRVERVELAAD